ncbi:hypothetical protein AJ80_07314 [Polytolypa hystricis UAMH7299]|uniref:C2H2-type domain-containing protein n=1 Tax=Polytolypa hystricis (strain UAMH7299) TaxID=1447883 RepID=A0A2B7XR00_POLH7|nr:hypothetical protein AJ80_07314 [Polytolypa hystricis UAMH7299]
MLAHYPPRQSQSQSPPPPPPPPSSQPDSYLHPRHLQQQDFFASPAYLHHQLQQQLQHYQQPLPSTSTSSSQQQFCATPLTPAPSQSQCLPLSFTSSQGAASYSSPSASPAYSSSPVFSPQNSPLTDYYTSFDLSIPEGFSSQTPPPIKLQQSTTPFGDQSIDQPSVSMQLQQSGLSLDGSVWDSSLGNFNFHHGLSVPSKPRQQGFFGNTRHRKALSGPSVVPASSTRAVGSPLSSQSASSFSPSTFASHDAFDRSNNLSSLSTTSLPTPESTPIQSAFIPSPFQSFDPSSRDVDCAETDMTMRHAGLEDQKRRQQQQQRIFDEDGSYPNSLAPTVSTLSHNSPVTPQAGYAEDIDESSNKSIPHGEDRFPDVDRWMDDYLLFDGPADYSGQVNNGGSNVNLRRTMSDIFQDELYDPTTQTMAQPPSNTPTANNQRFPQLRNVMADRLQAAHQGHISAAQSQSPTLSMTRERSPFRHDSPFALNSAFRTSHLQQPSHLNASLQMADQQQPGMQGMGLLQEDQNEPKTISPKDAVLDYNETAEDANMPLFPPPSSEPQFHLPTSIGSTSSFQPGPNFPAMEQLQNQYAQPRQQFRFMQQPHQQQFPIQLQNANHQQQQNLRQVPQQQGRHENELLHRTPQFPPSLPTMESTNSEANNSSPIAQRHPATSHPVEAVARPEDTSTDAGTYSCTYHGCTQRFETPARLQRHKREAHRPNTPGSHGLGRDPTSALRNSQAGPHRCERINPATGKRCNSVFSRPYDLTRHEDTIHNARKQKVRCHLCTEEKTFSRNDALTRHMRVVHPEVDWPGKQKQKRRGRD